MTEQYRPRDINRTSYECLTCGALVLDMSRHDEWHARLRYEWAPVHYPLGDDEDG